VKAALVYHARAALYVGLAWFEFHVLRRQWTVDVWVTEVYDAPVGYWPGLRTYRSAARIATMLRRGSYIDTGLSGVLRRVRWS
jgi:hypothetical protein